MKELTGRHVLIMLLAFFGVTMAVNGVFMYKAISTFNGQEVNSYSAGLHYNQRIAEAEAQTNLQWTHKVELGDAGTVQVALTDKNGAPVTGLNIVGDITRPAVDRFTHKLALLETKPGVYTASPGELDIGSWIVTLAASRAGQDEQPIYRLKERLCYKTTCPLPHY
jgi:nitrogen fixation protein FixH